jgi:hypothetical protein
MTPGTRELLAPRADVWGFLAEPYHLSDWWPGIVGVEPDHRGFAPGARWAVNMVDDPDWWNFFRLPRMGRPSGRTAPFILVIDEIVELERWSWQIFARVRNDRAPRTKPRTSEVSLRLLADDRTEVSVIAMRGSRYDERLAQAAADRLYDLVQTTATM